MSNISTNIYTEPNSNIAWGAIICGALAAATVSLLLIILGSGFGLFLTYPWQESGIYVKDFTLKTAVWLIVMQWLSSAFGGYLTGCLNTKWMNISAEDTFFRDTVHGFLAWSIATLVTITIFSSVILSIMNSDSQAVPAITADLSEDGDGKNNLYDPLAYYTDILLRGERPASGMAEDEIRNETARILINTIRNDAISEQDKTYLMGIIASRTNISPEDAASRIDGVIEQIKTAEVEMHQTADSAIKISEHISIYTFLSMLIGAFIASVAAALGGRHRNM